MAKEFNVDINLNRNELRGAIIEALAGPPPTPIEGQTYYDTSLKVERFYNGSEWVSKGVAGGGSTPKFNNPITVTLNSEKMLII